MTKLLTRSLTIFAAAMIFAFTPVFAWAADSSVDVSFYKNSNTVTVTLQNPANFDDDVNALQLTLSMDAAKGNMDGITPGFVFNTAYAASVKQARYNSSVDDLTIYVAGAQQNLLPENTNLVLGWIVFNAVDSASATFDVNVAPGSLSMIGNMRNPLTGEAQQNADAPARVTINGTTVTVDAKDSPRSGGSGSVGGDSKSSLPRDGYNPATDSPEKYNGNINLAGTPNPDNLDPSAGASADESLTSTSNVSPSVARAQRDSDAAEQAGGLPVPAIVGIVVAAAVVAGLLFYFLYWRKRKA